MTYPPPPYPPAYPPRPKTSGMAIASLGTGIGGLVLSSCLFFFPVLPILAVVFGHISISQINRQGLSGRGLAVAGLITGYIGLAISIVLLVLIIIGTVTSPTPTF